MANYVESETRSDRLKCSECGERIPKGVAVVFLIAPDSHRPMKAVYCVTHSEQYHDEVLKDETHPFSDDAFHY